MGCRGVHFAITERHASALLNADGDEALMEIIEDIEENNWDDCLGTETDTAWDAIHRCLSDGTLNLQAGSPPLNWAVFGGRQLYEGGDYYIVYLSPDQVKQVAEALKPITKEEMQDRYQRMAEDYQGERSEEDFEYTWEWFQPLKEFYAQAAKANRAAIFTVDQ